MAISKLFFFPSWKCGDLVFFFLPISQNVAISKLFFFPSWKCGDLVCFFTYFSKCGDFKTLLFPFLEMWRFSFFLKPISQNVTISKLFFFPSWKCGDLVFFFWKFFKMLTSPCMFSWGTFQQIFVTKN